MVRVQTSACVIPVLCQAKEALKRVKKRYDDEPEFPVPHIKLFHPFVETNKFEQFESIVAKQNFELFDLEFSSIGHRQLSSDTFAIVFEPSPESIQAFTIFWESLVARLPEELRTVKPRPWIQLGTCNRTEVEELKHKIANQLTCFKMPVNCLVCAELRGNCFNPKTWIPFAPKVAKPVVRKTAAPMPEPKNSCSLVFGEPGFYEVTSSFNMQTGHKRLARGKLVLVHKIRGGSAEISFPSRGTIQFVRRNLKARFPAVKVGMYELAQRISVRMGRNQVKVRHGTQAQVKNTRGDKVLVSFKKRSKKGSYWTNPAWVSTISTSGELLFVPFVDSSDAISETSSVTSFSSLSSNVGSSVFSGETSTFGKPGIYRSLKSLDVLDKLVCGSKVATIAPQRSVYIKEVHEGFALLSAPKVGWVEFNGQALISSSKQEVLSSISN